MRRSAAAGEASESDGANRRPAPRGRSASLKAVVAVLATLGVTLTLTAAVSAPANAASWTFRDPFTREIVRPGDVDASPYDIEHVYEVQYRLKWLGLFDATPNGNFGPITKAAVIRFQKRNGLAQTGVVNYKTWKPLIQKTIRGKRVVPGICKSEGWHACYDRRRHQVNLYQNGRLHNSWLVRGGGYDTQSRRGNFTVYYRDIDHYSRTFGGAPMPYSQFYSGGQALHGSRLMMDPFEGHSHGCVNFWTEDARQLWNLTANKKLYVHVYGAWD